MKYLLKHLKLISCLFSFLILFQSCVIYEKSPATIADALGYESKRMKVITQDRAEYKLYWIDEKDENIVSIKNTKRVRVDTVEITRIIKFDPEPVAVNLDLAKKYDGIVQITTKKRTYNFIKIEVRNELVEGLMKLARDTSSVIIPKDQIADIKLKDKIGSTAGNVAITIGAILGITATVILFSADWSWWE